MIAWPASLCSARVTSSVILKVAPARPPAAQPGRRRSLLAPHHFYATCVEHASRVKMHLEDGYLICVWMHDVLNS